MPGVGLIRPILEFRADQRPRGLKLFPREPRRGQHVHHPIASLVPVAAGRDHRLECRDPSSEDLQDNGEGVVPSIFKFVQHAFERLLEALKAALSQREAEFPALGADAEPEESGFLPRRQIKNAEAWPTLEFHLATGEEPTPGLLDPPRLGLILGQRHQVIRIAEEGDRPQLLPHGFVHEPAEDEIHHDGRERGPLVDPGLPRASRAAHAF